MWLEKITQGKLIGNPQTRLDSNWSFLIRMVCLLFVFGPILHWIHLHSFLFVPIHETCWSSSSRLRWVLGRPIDVIQFQTFIGSNWGLKWKCKINDKELSHVCLNKSKSDRVEKYSICHFLWDCNHRTDYVKTWSSMTKNIEGIEGIKLSLEFVKIFTPSGVRGFRLFFHLKFSSLEVRELILRTGRTLCANLRASHGGKVRVTPCNFHLFCVFCFISSHSLRRRRPCLVSRGWDQHLYIIGIVLEFVQRLFHPWHHPIIYI